MTSGRIKAAQHHAGAGRLVPRRLTAQRSRKEACCSSLVNSTNEYRQTVNVRIALGGSKTLNLT